MDLFFFKEEIWKIKFPTLLIILIFVADSIVFYYYTYNYRIIFGIFNHLLNLVVSYIGSEISRQIH